MERRLTAQQLEQIVGEVGRLADRQQAELDRSEVQKILQELNLPPELLDEAMVQVQRKEALARQQQRNRGIAIASIAALVAIVIGTGMFFQTRSSSLAKITATQDRITLVQDNGENLQAVDRGAAIAYRVTLNDAPVGETLNLTCNWLDPTGKVVHTNRYDTKNITTPVWNTQCRYQLPANAATGAWIVQMKVGDRIIEQSPFDVN
ncbi:hypothetical protein [Chamaesiphon minutus]|uniref:DUF3859 domain-containing protein n=1 Tax=Chamaesiphon minutus (strain ATCC 27169 / PCC 6605) TaxID=1173020 RepID=K9UHX7_CHAP6|nr:hypothetical protein [Chamaesiphon minutus]AFY94061.1 hypothetical protein Cha6605_3029 [Chamaesiphon minutus PCC 6605]